MSRVSLDLTTNFRLLPNLDAKRSRSCIHPHLQRTWKISRWRANSPGCRHWQLRKPAYQLSMSGMWMAYRAETCRVGGSSLLRFECCNFWCLMVDLGHGSSIQPNSWWVTLKMRGPVLKGQLNLGYLWEGRLPLMTTFPAPRKSRKKFGRIVLGLYDCLNCIRVYPL